MHVANTLTALHPYCITRLLHLVLLLFLLLLLLLLLLQAYNPLHMVQSLVHGAAHTRSALVKVSALGFRPGCFMPEANTLTALLANYTCHFFPFKPPQTRMVHGT